MIRSHKHWGTTSWITETHIVQHRHDQSWYFESSAFRVHFTPCDGLMPGHQSVVLTFPGSDDFTLNSYRLDLTLSERPRTDFHLRPHALSSPLSPTSRSLVSANVWKMAMCQCLVSSLACARVCVVIHSRRAELEQGPGAGTSTVYVSSATLI